MYPFLRFAKEFWVFRNAPPLGVFDTHVSNHICWPWDLDLWIELNNGRTLTLFDLGRMVMVKRTGFAKMTRRERWLPTVAGVSVRYRKRVRMFDRFQMTSRCIGWDERFLYLEHAMWRGETCTSHVLVRMAVTDANGMIPVSRVLKAFGPIDAPMEPLPEWVQAWIAAENLRPWPPVLPAAPQPVSTLNPPLP